MTFNNQSYVQRNGKKHTQAQAILNVQKRAKKLSPQDDIKAMLYTANQ